MQATKSRLEKLHKINNVASLTNKLRGWKTVWRDCRLRAATKAIWGPCLDPNLNKSTVKKTLRGDWGNVNTAYCYLKWLKIALWLCLKKSIYLDKMSDNARYVCVGGRGRVEWNKIGPVLIKFLKIIGVVLDNSLRKRANDNLFNLPSCRV